MLIPQTEAHGDWQRCLGSVGKGWRD